MESQENEQSEVMVSLGFILRGWLGKEKEQTERWPVSAQTARGVTFTCLELSSLAYLYSWPLGQQHLYYLKTYQKCKFSDPTSDG